MDVRPGIALPSDFTPTTPASLRAYVGACLEFLTSPLVSSLLECHPNDIAVEGPRTEWQNWWDWAGRGQAKWRFLVSGWPRGDDEVDLAAEIPLELRKTLEAIDSLTLPRTPESDLISSSLPQMRGMSPKKSHEVSRMSAYIGSLLSQTRSSHEIKHVVDVGAGQGYLSRALSERPHSMNVLALDFSEVQTMGAERRGRNIKKKSAKAKETTKENMVHLDLDTATSVRSTIGTVTHEMIHINPQTLKSSISSWISAVPSSSQVTTPVLLVGLHACGSLTPDILRSYVTYRKSILSSTEKLCYNWYPAGAVVVGCCYNLMSPESDFPMSMQVSEDMANISSRLLLSYNHRSLAAQSPSQWLLNTSTTSAAKLAIRKVVYRALLERQAALSAANLKETPERYGKVGRLHDSAYASLHTFISQFNTKNGSTVPIPEWEDVNYLASCLEVLHVLRSRIGPVVESLILVDRWLYLAENLPADEVLSVNLFDQNCGSARNVALVVRPNPKAW